ncbi:hypothetical protein FACS1894206_09700 [Deltaproteobacteria bacterium]|nr:hypothetical protein FACS1894206_09700 [Deltaproteobacteria bacterium]
MLLDYEVSLHEVNSEQSICEFINNEAPSLDVVVLPVGGREVTFFMKALEKSIKIKKNACRPLIISMLVGIALDNVFLGAFQLREPADVVLVNKRSDVPKVARLFQAVAKEDISPFKVLPSRCPIFDEDIFQPIDYSLPPQNSLLCRADQHPQQA